MPPLGAASAVNDFTRMRDWGSVKRTGLSAVVVRSPGITIDTGWVVMSFRRWIVSGVASVGASVIVGPGTVAAPTLTKFVVASAKPHIGTLVGPGSAFVSGFATSHTSVAKDGTAVRATMPTADTTCLQRLIDSDMDQPPTASERAARR